MRNIIGNSVDKAITALAVMLGVLSNRLTNSTKAFLRPGDGKLGVRAAFLMLSLIAALIVTSPAAIAESGDFTIEFVAAAPESYNHLIGGGAYDDRTIGVSDDVVKSLEGADFSCGDIVTYFAVRWMIPFKQILTPSRPSRWIFRSWLTPPVNPVWPLATSCTWG